MIERVFLVSYNCVFWADFLECLVLIYCYLSIRKRKKLGSLCNFEVMFDNVYLLSVMNRSLINKKL